MGRLLAGSLLAECLWIRLRHSNLTCKSAGAAAEELFRETPHRGVSTTRLYRTHRKWFGNDYNEPAPPEDEKRGWHVIWFNPWQHQFEETPLVALLHEIRQHFSLTRKMFDEAGKLIDVSVHSSLNMLDSLAKTLRLPLPTVSAKSIMERGREYEAEQFSTALSSQRFRDFFEKAIGQVIGRDGRMVIFIDDLDRCEGAVAYRLLESLKLYLNARNCIYVLGLDQGHLEETIARVLSGSEETWRYRPLARDYLSKMFQNLFLLPVPTSIKEYASKLLNKEDEAFKSLLKKRFGMTDGEWPDQVVKTLDENLPHNPRKVKSFIAAWKLYLKLLASRQPEEIPLEWRLTLVLNYLGQFEEPLFRKVEQAPGFYTDHIVSFCKKGTSAQLLFDGLERPYRAQATAEEITGGISSASIKQQQATPVGVDGNDDAKQLPPPRVFWIGSSVNELGDVDREKIQRHLLCAEILLAIAPVKDKGNASEKS